MSSSAPSTTSTDDTAIWSSLKQAISSSSGFQRWDDSLATAERTNSNLDDRVRRYLRETLATLAY